MITHAPADHDVVIVGLGPIGATLANLLGICGLSVLVLEKEQQIYPLPRAVHFDDEIMRVFQAIGVAELLGDKIIVNKGTRFVDQDGSILLDWPRPQEITRQGWHASYRFHQPDLEQELRLALQRFDTVDAKLGHVADSIIDHGDHVAVSYHDKETDQNHHGTAKYVVGCDGARSLVRQIMGTTMHQLGFEQRWLVVDLLLKRDKPELGKHTLQFCDPVRPATYCCNFGNRRRFEFALLDNEDSDDMSRPEAVWRLLSKWLSDDEADLERKAIYTFESAVAKTWKQGRLLLAGDAAHLTPPFMGQGLCAGMRDVSNLAWKLTLCCKGRATEALLATYQSERIPNVTSYIETAVSMGKLVNSMGSLGESELGKNSRNGSAVMKSLQLKLGQGLGNVENQNRGMLFSQPKLSNGLILDDVVGYQPFLIVGDENFSQPASQGLQVISASGEPEIKSALSDIGVMAVSIRPDRYILDTVQKNEDIDRLIKSAWPSPLN